MDQHFSIDIARYTQSTNILVGFNLYKPLVIAGNTHKKVIGTIVSHSETENINGQNCIRVFYVILNWHRESYKRAQTASEKQRLISVIETDNIVSYELATIKSAIPKWSAPSLAKARR
jgi:hypothetical protein